jgi:hypothetical protein
MIKTADEVKKMTSDPDCIKVVNALFEAIAYTETVKALIEPKQQEVVDFFKFEISPKRVALYKKRGFDMPLIIDSPRNLYEASAEDCELYYKEMHKIHRELGFDVELHYCPILIAENMVSDLKKEVCDFLEPYMGIKYEQISYSLDFYRKYFELVMTMFAPTVKEYQKTNAIKEK